jgi:hypothetical protein
LICKPALKVSTRFGPWLTRLSPTARSNRSPSF